MEKRFLTVVEVAQYLGFSQAAIRRWRRSGMIPITKINGGVRFDKYQIDKWLEERSQNNVV